MWGIMSKAVFEEETGHLRLVTGGCRQVVARFDGKQVWVWCKATMQEEPIDIETLLACHEKMKR